MKRQRSAESSSSRRENAQEKPHAKSVGCMSAVIQCVSKSQSSRKFLTFGKKQNKDESSFPVKAGLPEANPRLHGGENREEEPVDGRKLSSEVPRSPTLPADIRQKTPSNSTQEDFRNPPSLVARLMGLEERPATAEIVAEKRQMLLGALQKCDEDLQALKKIIDAVRCKDQLQTPSPMISTTAGDKIRTAASPVSVLCPSSFPQQRSIGRMQPQQKQQLLRKPGEEEISNTYFYGRMARELLRKEEESVMRSSKAMIESVEEVCKDMAWGEKRELGRIGLALQDHICRDLIEEIVSELRSCCFYVLPLEACKRRLCF